MSERNLISLLTNLPPCHLHLNEELSKTIQIILIPLSVLQNIAVVTRLHIHDHIILIIKTLSMISGHKVFVVFRVKANNYFRQDDSNNYLALLNALVELY